MKSQIRGFQFIVKRKERPFEFATPNDLSNISILSEITSRPDLELKGKKMSIKGFNFRVNKISLSILETSLLFDKNQKQKTNYFEEMKENKSMFIGMPRVKGFNFVKKQNKSVLI